MKMGGERQANLRDFQFHAQSVDADPDLLAVLPRHTDDTYLFHL
jgi:hypothetical protein